MDSFEPNNVAEWRAWLEVNHNTSIEIWLVIPKGRKGGSALTMTDAVDEAMCFGWIDSRTKGLDEDRFMLRMTPRKEVTNWSERNLKRAKALIDEGRMTEAGIFKLPSDFLVSAVKSGPSSEENATIPPELESALNKDTDVWNTFQTLAPGKRREFVRWVSSAKRPETRSRRIARTVELVKLGRSLTEEMMSKWSKE
jgi:uncharacterized protein YdeI (YjbR/CyaY-like superfamily)